MSEQYIEKGTQFSPEGKSAAEIWSLLRDLLAALSYAHQLGMAHGRLQPEYLIVDQSGKLHITRWGQAALTASMAPAPPGDTSSGYISPEARLGHPPDLSDDYYSLGCLILHCVTGKAWAGPDADGRLSDTLKATLDVLNNPLPPALEPLLMAMLQPASYDRAVDFQAVEDALADHFDRQDRGIESIAFERGAQPGDTPPPAPQPPLATRDAFKVPASTVLAGFIALVAVTIALFLYLPDEPQPSSTDPTTTKSLSATPTRKPNTTPGTTPDGLATTIAPFEQARLDLMKEQGRDLARQILRQQVRLEDQGVALWAGDTYSDLASVIEAADEHYRNQQYQLALDSYQSVLARLDELLASTASVLAEQIETGQAALAAGDHQTALVALTIANVIDRNNPALKSLLTRAENLEQVITLMRQGEVLEANEKYRDALAAYNQASTLDPAWAPAGKARRRVEAAMRQQRFGDAMSLAFRALSEGNYDAARESFTSAQKILPDSPEPADGLLQVEQAKNTDMINTHRQQAKDYQANEQWAKATEQYQAALAIDPTLVFATAGVSHTRFRLALENKLKRYLSDPTLMQTDKALADAGKTLATAAKVATKSAQFKGHLDTLARLISTARIPVPVQITSDQKTDVTVYKVGQFGALAQKELQLIPGKYTIVGKRPGYQDVRHALTIRSGEPVAPIQIICSEKI